MRREKELKDIFEIKNKLLICPNIEAVIKTALESVATTLLSQTVSIFLFSKDGYLERVGIRGVDKDNVPISDDWFKDERYKVGASFTGKAALPAEGSSFGEPQWSVNLNQDQIDEKSKNAYNEKLGIIRSAIAVPLNGQHRTFGVLEVLNKINEQGERLIGEEGVFSIEDVYRLSLIGMNLATAISLVRARNELETLANISRMLVEPLNLESDFHPVYQYTVEKLVNPLSYYKACILRIGGRADTVEVVAKAGDDITWDKGIDEPLKKGEAITGEIYATGELVLVPDIEKRKSDFKTYEWIRANGLKSYAGFPLKVENKILGTLSIYIGFNYEFYEGNLNYLTNIAYLIAAFTRNLNVMSELATLNDEIGREKEELMNYARDVAFTREYEDVMHEYKNELFNILHALKESERSSPGKKTQIIQEQITWVKKRVEEIKQSFGGTSVIPVNLNHVIRGLAKLFMSEKKKKLRFIYNFDLQLPNIMANEAEMRDVVFNLFSNAVKAIEKAGQKHGEVKVSTSVVEADIEYLQLIVEDNGIGIKHEDWDKIYNKKFSTYEGGTGMGLHITRKIVSAYGGKIFFDSAVGKGTKFFVRIPLEWNREEEDL